MDNISANIDTTVYYRIIDPSKATFRVQDVEHSVEDITYATLRTVCGEHKLQDLLENRQKVSDEIEAFVLEHVKEWGIILFTRGLCRNGLYNRYQTLHRHDFRFVDRSQS